MQTATQNKHASQSNSFFKLRNKMQNQMKKNNINYDDILKRTKEIKDDK